MPQKTIMISIKKLQLNMDNLTDFFPSLESSLQLIDLQIFHENEMKKIEQIPIKREKKASSNQSGDKRFILSQMVSEIFRSKLLKEIEIWVIDSETQDILGSYYFFLQLTDV